MEFVKGQSRTLQSEMKWILTLYILHVFIHFYLYLTLSSTLSWTAGLPSLLHSFDSVAYGAHAERHLRTVRLPAWTSKWQITGTKNLRKPIMVNHRFILNYILLFCCQIENCVPLILVIFLLEQNTNAEECLFTFRVFSCRLMWLELWSQWCGSQR